MSIASAARATSACIWYNFEEWHMPLYDTCMYHPACCYEQLVVPNVLHTILLVQISKI